MAGYMLASTWSQFKLLNTIFCINEIMPNFDYTSIITEKITFLVAIGFIHIRKEFRFSRVHEIINAMCKVQSK